MNNLFTSSRDQWAPLACPSHSTPAVPAPIPVWFGAAMLEVDWERHELCRGDGRREKLSRREQALLACLAARAGKVVTRDELLESVWRLDPDRTITRTVDMHISMLRRKLGDDAAKPVLLITLRRFGYMLRAGALTAREPGTSTGQSPSRSFVPRASMEGKKIQ